jgi:hypothetical protein
MYFLNVSKYVLSVISLKSLGLCLLVKGKEYAFTSDNGVVTKMISVEGDLLILKQGAVGECPVFNTFTKRYTSAIYSLNYELLKPQELKSTFSIISVITISFKAADIVQLVLTYNRPFLNQMNETQYPA